MAKHITSTSILIVFGDTFFYFDVVHYELCVLDWIEDNNIKTQPFISNNFYDNIQGFEVYSEEDYIALKLAFS